MNSTLISVINDIEKTEIGENMSAKQFMALARVIEYRETEHKRALMAALQASCTDEEWGRISKKMALAFT